MKCDKYITEKRNRELVASGTTTWMFKTVSGDTIYSTNYKKLGMPQFGSIGPNGCKPKYLQNWYYGDCLRWKYVKDDRFNQIINPSCIFIGSK
jgi:hypothetical protein